MHDMNIFTMLLASQQGKQDTFRVDAQSMCIVFDVQANIQLFNYR